MKQVDAIRFLTKWLVLLRMKLRGNVMIKLEFYDDWNGGRFEPSLKSVKEIFINGEKIPFKVIEIHGSDYDHGHNYSWSNYDLKLCFQSKQGLTIESSLREMIKKNDFYVVTK